MGLIFVLRTRKDTNEGVGILIYESPQDVWHGAGEDDTFAHNVITSEQFHHMQTGCDTPPHHHRYEGHKLVEKQKIDLACDKHNITINQDTATLTWNAPKPVMISVDGARQGPYNNTLPVSASAVHVYTVAIDDPEYWSDPVFINAEEPLKAA